MILPDFILPTRQNQIWTESGIDSLDRCLDKKHFKSYPYPIEYRYNSRGYRDAEWPEDVSELENAIWCFGDSFTVGIGSPVEHTWAHLLQQHTNRRVINISMDGASNNWISRKAVDLLELIQPKTIILHWSYLHRREASLSAAINNQQPGKSGPVTDSERSLWTDESWHAPVLNTVGDVNDINNFFQCVQRVDNAASAGTQIIHSIIPNFSRVTQAEMLTIWNDLRGPDWPVVPPKTNDEFAALSDLLQAELIQFGSYNDFKDHVNLYDYYNKLQYNVPEFSRLDLGRDGHHYDKITATSFVEKLLDLIALPH